MVPHTYIITENNFNLHFFEPFELIIDALVLSPRCAENQTISFFAKSNSGYIIVPYSPKITKFDQNLTKI